MSLKFKKPCTTHVQLYVSYPNDILNFFNNILIKSFESMILYTQFISFYNSEQSVPLTNFIIIL